MCDEQYKYGLNTYEAKLSWVAIQTDQPENKMRDQAPGEHLPLLWYFSSPWHIFQFQQDASFLL